MLHQNLDDSVGSAQETLEEDAGENSSLVNSAPSGMTDEGSACQTCRKRKTKCSRQHPCAQCEQLGTECIFQERAKPGIRRGAMGSLNQRLDKLENMFLGQSVLWQQVWSTISSIQNQISPQAVNGNRSDERDSLSLDDCVRGFTDALSQSADLSYDKEKDVDNVKRPRKRQRTGRETLQPQPEAPPSLLESTDELLSPDIMEQLIKIYFSHIHPWIPIIHEGRFHTRRKCANQAIRLKTLFHAIAAATVRLCDDPRLGSPAQKAEYAKRTRRRVIISGMEQFSVENLQALVITTFDIIGSGQGPAAWSTVGSMTRTVEHLHLSAETEAADMDRRRIVLMQRLAFLPPPESWIEEEERRRIFWVVFLMDRFCSVATGWEVSLPSAQIKRRLPCHGPLWREGNPVSPLPYFEIMGRGTAQSLDEQTISGTSSIYEVDEVPSIGGLAYRVEATEILSLVTAFFVKHPLFCSSLQHTQMWMMRFRELDLRLTQWKLLLPEKWREPAVFNENGSMDENLCLAHAFHNTAMILLHQTPAYPSQQLQDIPVQLSAEESTKACLTSASAVCLIASNLLHFSGRIIAPEMAFCLFISGRLLLAHSWYCGATLPQEFDRIMESLREMSRRWDGCKPDQTAAKITQNAGENLAAKFASRLVQARNLGAAAAIEEPSLVLQHSVFSENTNHQSPPRVELDARLPSARPAPWKDSQDPFNFFLDDINSAFSLASPPLPSTFQPSWARGFPQDGSNTQTNGHSLKVSSSEAYMFPSQNVNFAQKPPVSSGVMEQPLGNLNMLLSDQRSSNTTQ